MTQKPKNAQVVRDELTREKELDSDYKLVLEIYVLRKSVQTRLLELREIKAPLWSHPWRGGCGSGKKAFASSLSPEFKEN